MIAALLLTAAVVTRGIAAAPGPNRLEPGITVLSGTAAPLRYDVESDRDERRFVFRGGLDDLRLHDQDGNEIEYLLIAPPARVPRWTTARSILPIPPTKTTSGFEADLGSVRPIDRIELRGIDAPFLKRVRVDGSGDRVHWTVLAAEVSVFDLPEQRLRNVAVAFARGEYRYIRLVWDDRSSARVRRVGGLAARLSDPASPAPATLVPVAFRKTSSETGRSRYRLTLPGAHLPIGAVEIRVRNANVFREASVSEPRFDGATLVPVVLGSGQLRRAERDGTVAEQMSIPISFPTGANLDLAIEDGNSGPLEIESMSVRLAPLPWIYFEAPADKAITASWGDPSLHQPRYDLEASRSAVEKARPVAAVWAGAAASARPPAEAPMPLAGATVARESFRRARSAGSPPQGLISLLLDAEVLTHSAAGLGDLRLVGPGQRQVPYVLEKREAPLVLALAIPKRVANGKSSIYRFDLPYDHFPSGTRIIFTTGARVFDRAVVLQKTEDESQGRAADVLAAAEWRSADPESDPPPLELPAPAAGRVIELRIDEGDNAPLPLASAQLMLPSYALRFFSAGSPLTLLYDDPTAAPPRYDLALLAPRVLAEPARDVTLPPAAPPSGEKPPPERVIFWGVIAAATALLLVTLGRLLRNA